VQESGGQTVVKSGLPQATRPSEPENRTDIDECIQRLQQNDSTLTDINLNNMKVGRRELIRAVDLAENYFRPLNEPTSFN
jgi:hypothetical protein